MGDSSRWSGYLQSLPFLDLPTFWNSEPSARSNGIGPVLGSDPDNPLVLLRGSEVMKRLEKKDDAGRTLRDNVDDYYHKIVLRILRQSGIRRHLALEPSLAGFRQAYSLVSSRAFLLDAYHGLAMTPIADAFNHALENHVHIQTDFYVCPECGSLRECEHDSEGRDQTHDMEWKANDYDAYYEMVSNADIVPYEEVFNTYGEKLCNAELLVQFGFIIDPNDNDTVNFDINDILREAPLSQETYNKIPCLDDAELAPLLDSFTVSDLIFAQDPSNVEARFCINCDGKISHFLWIFLVRLLCQNMPLVGPSNSMCSDKLREMTTTQINMENMLQEGSVEDGDGQLDLPGSPVIPVLLAVAQAVVAMCGARKGGSGHPGYANRDLGDILDTIAVDRSRSRLSLSILMSEHSILDSCSFGWLDFVNAFNSSDGYNDGGISA
ncbi:SET domain-containing protein [Macrolepiota fuliginosa MF-IS2]|uniref:SET domain-containing protein n=1 Tax=Macrolepiota fuliginosa MF-IS2 TaxID=1400762 RepID=A0A9P5XAP9_9AGAR|nr:SET domain-containing protein [Macrolepiota fuliginosa MF-IS2]